MIRSAIFTSYLMSMTVLFACDGAEEAKGPVIQPKKEATWVRTEKVQTTKEELFLDDKEILADIPLNTSLIKNEVGDTGLNVLVLYGKSRVD